jgi:hypothetical protein
MAEKTYRIVQWRTGDVGYVGVRDFVDSPVCDPVGGLAQIATNVCDAPQGSRTHRDLGLIRPRGLVRR